MKKFLLCINRDIYTVKGDLDGTTLSHTISLTTGLRHESFRVNQTYNSLTTVVYVTKKCRRILKHVLKSYGNRRYRQCWVTRVVCDFLHDASSARSRNRMRQSKAKVVPSKSALKNSLTVLFVKLQAVRIRILFYVGASFRLKNRTRCEIRSLNHGQVSVAIRFLRTRVLFSLSRSISLLFTCCEYLCTVSTCAFTIYMLKSSIL